MFSSSHWLEYLELRTLFSASYDLIGLTALRNDPAFKTIDGRGVSVVVIDTGLDTTHPLISPNYITGADIVGGGNTPTVTNPHGTHVAGIIGSKADSSRNYDGGVAPGVGLIALNVFSEGAGGEVTADNRSIEKALQWVEDNQKKYNIVAVNMSLGGGFYKSPDEVAGDVYADEISSLQKNGVTVVSAAGNSYGLVQDPNSGQLLNVAFPNSGSPGILSTLDVGAVWDKNEGGDFIWGNGSVDNTTGPDRITSFSQRPPPAVGNGIFAPGAIITSTWPGNQLQQTQGTSQASPMVAGAVALMQDAAGTFGGRLLSPKEVRSILQTTGDTINDGDNEDDAVFVDSNGNGQVDSGELQSLKNTGLNYPRINVYRALKKIAQMFGIGGGSSADPNGTIDGAILGPTLNGAKVDPISGILGSDGTKVIGNRDIDMFQFTISAPGQVTIEVASDPDHKADFDSYLRLFNASGKQVAADDNGGAGSFSQIKKTLQPGTYYAGVTGTGNTSYDPLTAKGTKPGKSGNFLIGFSLKSNDPNGLISGAVNVNLAGSDEKAATFDGNIGTDYGVAIATADVDLFKIVVPDNGQLLVDIDTPFDSNYVDSYLRVFDSAGNEIGVSDDDLATDVEGNRTETTDGSFDYDATSGDAIGHATDSFVIGDVTRGDVYYFGISDAGNHAYDAASLSGRGLAGAGGQYELTASFANNDHNGSIAQAVATTSLPVSNILGSIGTDLGDSVGNRDVDMFKITPTTAGILNINVDSYSLANNTDPVDTVLKLFDSTGKLLATSDDVDGPDPLLQISLDPNNDYYVAVAGKGNENFDPFVLGSGSPGDTGLYNLSIDVLDSSVGATLSDDTIGSAPVQTVTTGSRIVASVGLDNGYVRGDKDVDIYKFVASKAEDIEVRAGVIDAFGGDTYLRIFDSGGKELVANDNDGANTVDSRVQLHVTKGTYYIGVSGHGNAFYNATTGSGATAGSTGQYALQVNGGFASVSSGVLSVGGGKGDDSIHVTRTSTTLKAIVNGGVLNFKSKGITSVVIAASDGNDIVTLANDVPAAYIDGGAGNDSLSGGDGNDTLTAGAGKNTLAGNNGDDRLNGSGGRDLLQGGADDDRLYGNGGNDTLDGGGGIDRLFGGDGDDSLLGGASNDKLYAQAGDDTLNGQAGADLIDGGEGADSALADVLDTRISIENVI